MLWVESDQVTEPRRVGVWGCLREYEPLHPAKTLRQICKVLLSRLRETVQFIELRNPQCRLHVRCFEVVANVTVNVFVVIAERQVTELPAKTFATRVVFPRLAIAI